jgi:hypothetical protein
MVNPIRSGLMPPQEDPVLRNTRREAIIIGLVWFAATLYCCFYSYFFGYIREGHPLGPADLKPILGMPSWFFWGILIPWGLCGVFTFWLAGFFMADDDLGADHTAELEEEIREGGIDA